MGGRRRRTGVENEEAYEVENVEEAYVDCVRSVRNVEEAYVDCVRAKTPRSVRSVEEAYVDCVTTSIV